MSEVTWNNILATGYLLTWIMTLIWYQYKSRTIDGASATISLYISIRHAHDGTVTYHIHPSEPC